MWESECFSASSSSRRSSIRGKSCPRASSIFIDFQASVSVARIESVLPLGLGLLLCLSQSYLLLGELRQSCPLTRFAQARHTQFRRPQEEGERLRPDQRLFKSWYLYAFACAVERRLRLYLQALIRGCLLPLQLGTGSRRHLKLCFNHLEVSSNFGLCLCHVRLLSCLALYAVLFPSLRLQSQHPAGTSWMQRPEVLFSSPGA